MSFTPIKAPQLIKYILTVIVVLAAASLWLAYQWNRATRPSANPSGTPAGEALLERLLGSTPATKADWKAFRIIKVTPSNPKLTAVAFNNIRPLLEMDKNADAHNLRVIVTRNNGGVQATVFGIKAKSPLCFDLIQAKVTPATDVMGSENTFDETSSANRFNMPIRIFAGIDENKISIIRISEKVDAHWIRSYIPYELGDCILQNPYLMLNYPIAISPKLSRGSERFVSVILINTKNKSIVDEIEIPFEFKPSRPVFYIDKEAEVILAAGYHMDWLYIIDFKPYMDALRQAEKEEK